MAIFAREIISFVGVGDVAPALRVAPAAAHCLPDNVAPDITAGHQPPLWWGNVYGVGQMEAGQRTRRWRDLHRNCRVSTGCDPAQPALIAGKLRPRPDRELVWTEVHWLTVRPDSTGQNGHPIPMGFPVADQFPNAKGEQLDGPPGMLPLAHGAYTVPLQLKYRVQVVKNLKYIVPQQVTPGIAADCHTVPFHVSGKDPRPGTTT